MPSVTWDCGHDHERAGIAVEATVADVAYDADDLAGGFFELRPDAFADDDLLADGVFLWPVLFGHGLIDEDDAGGGAGVAVGEVAAAQDGDAEDVEVSGRCAHPAGAAGLLIFAKGTADDDEGKSVAAFEREAAGGGGGFDAGDGVEAFAAEAG